VLLTILVLPIAYLASLVALIVRRRRDGVMLSLLVFGVTIAAGAWSIMQSRSSTASIGFIFLPTLGSVAGGLALAYGATRRAGDRMLRMIGIIALLASAAPAVIALRGGRETTAKNQRRDADQARRDSAYATHRARLDTILARSGEGASDTLQALLRRNPGERELLLAALERPQLPIALLDSFARSPDLGIALQAIRNPNAPPETLERLYRTHQYRDYFLQTLAAHANTPPAILREIRSMKPAPITGLDIWFAENPSTPPDVLLDVARTSESIEAVRRLLQHPALDCTMIENATHGPAVRGNPSDTDIADRMAEARTRLCR
jgi:hypothetical protein